MNNYCKRCGAPITFDFVFCTECGVAVPSIETKLSALAERPPQTSPTWATVCIGFGLVSTILSVLTPFLLAVVGYFAGSPTKGYSVDGAFISFGIGVIGGAIILGSATILLAFGQLLRQDQNKKFLLNSSLCRYLGIAFLVISPIPFLVSAVSSVYLYWQTQASSEGEIFSLAVALLMLIGFIPSAVLYASGRALMACGQLLRFKIDGPFPVDPARYRGLGIAALIFGGSTPILTIIFTVVAPIMTPIGVIVGVFLLTLGYGIIPGSMLLIAGMILIACEQMFSNLLNGTNSGESIKYKAIGFAAIVLGVIVPITAVAKGFAAIIATIGAGGVIPALPPLYLGFVGCPVLIIGGVTLLAADQLVKSISSIRN